MNLHYSDVEQIKNLLDNYFEAVKHADIESLKTIFSEEAAMYGYLGDVCLSGTPEPFFQDLASKPSMAEQGTDCRYVVTSVHVTGKIATASIAVDNFFGAAYVEDYFHLVKSDDTWKIVCKTFTTL
ncbi:nuclear transport factor 2 family protein [Ruminococcus sp. OA3]|uniref:nuclear transport factor 2 family protein n=1 Tax=Ruminococcus sp. OA3 TaxID=2914164 RepID=UPI001F065728|nr:nuclear transport factor 2 family protein [Ruminococcus sp. OA3]MCH1983478.1 nuclear transport factor 2 family protein [Ruminococcus sp. OA3]